MGIMTGNDRPLSGLQLTILELEAKTWKRAGAKYSEFRRRHPGVTEIGYYLALKLLLSDRRAYEYDERRYAAMLTRIREQQIEKIQQRAWPRTVPAG